jgi:FKBP-type peptidyl-prolyl cis-trans isomerase
MFNKFELIGGAASILSMVLALYLIQANDFFSQVGEQTQSAQVVSANDAIVVVPQGENMNQLRANAFAEAADNKGNIKRMVIDDIKIGTGEEVKVGDVVSVHYVGQLQNGQEFDSSKKRGEPFEFTIGAGRVIEGWEEGVIGMKVGGERVLVIPPEKAYGEAGIGPIPGNATLVFSIELLNVK